MRRHVATAAGRLAAALLASGLGAFGIDAAPAKPASPPTPTAEEIVSRHVAARGGLEKLRSLKTLREEGHASGGAGREGLVMREIKRPGRIRFEFTVDGVTSVFATDGRRGWKVSPFDGELTPQPLPDEVVAEAREQAEIDGPLADWKKKGSTLELAGRESVDGKDAWKVKVTLRGGGVLHAWIDVKTAYLVKAETTRQLRGRPARIETTYGDFRKTGGILFPRLVEVRTAGRPQVLRIVVDKVEVNPPLSDALFTPPG